MLSTIGSVEGHTDLELNTLAHRLLVISCCKKLHLLLLMPSCAADMPWCAVRCCCPQLADLPTSCSTQPPTPIQEVAPVRYDANLYSFFGLKEGDRKSYIEVSIVEWEVSEAIAIIMTNVNHEAVQPGRSWPVLSALCVRNV
eukprot:1152292-Pelagomonas_calceolata.AAC.2